jgi:hypothetical protein
LRLENGQTIKGGQPPALHKPYRPRTHQAGRKLDPPPRNSWPTKKCRDSEATKDRKTSRERQQENSRRTAGERHQGKDSRRKTAGERQQEKDSRRKTTGERQQERASGESIRREHQEEVQRKTGGGKRGEENPRGPF